MRVFGREEIVKALEISVGEHQHFLLGGFVQLAVFHNGAVERERVEVGIGGMARDKGAVFGQCERVEGAVEFHGVSFGRLQAACTRRWSYTE